MVIDAPAMTDNIAAMMDRIRPTGVHVRPHLKTAKSPTIAKLMLQAGARGICVAKLAEAEVMAAHSIDDILITTEIAGRSKLARLVALVREHPGVKVVVDGEAGVIALEQALRQDSTTIDVLLELDVGQGRCGVLPGAPALALAECVRRQSRLRLVGLQGYEGHLQHIRESHVREERCTEAVTRLTETAEALRRAGFEIAIVTTGGTGTAEICARCPGVTEVQPGSFVFMDVAYRDAIGPGYAQALTVLSTVISRPRPGEAVVDAGLKSLSTDMGMPVPKGLPDVRYRPLGDEHGLLCWADDSAVALDVGDRLELIPSHIDTTINLHDDYVVVSDRRVTGIWPVAARGKVQ